MEHDKKSNEPMTKLVEGEEKQEQETGEITTTNHVF